MKIEPFDPEWEQMREDRIARRAASDATFETVIKKRRDNMKAFDASKDTLLISSNKKPLSYRGFKLMVRVNKYKVAGPVHVIGVILPDGTGAIHSMTNMTVEYDQNRAAAMRRIKARIDQYLDDRLKRSIAQLDAGQGVERELIDDAVTLSDDERAGYIEGRF